MNPYSNLTQRQQQLLNAIIKEFIESGQAVGSISLQTKYHFKVSPATIRNEMSELVDKDYLYMRHSSGGRIPTSKGIRFYISELPADIEDRLDIVTKEKIKIDLHQNKHQLQQLMRSGIKYLSNLTGNVSIALVDSDIYYAGLTEMLDIPELQEVNALKNLMSILEDYSKLSSVLNQADPENDEVKVLVGEETGLALFEDYSIVFSELKIPGKDKGYLAVIGLNRMNYQEVIPAIRYISDTISHLVKSW